MGAEVGTMTDELCGIEDFTDSECAAIDRATGRVNG